MIAFHTQLPDATPILVTFVFTPGEKGSVDAYGAPQEPDVDPEIEIVSAYAPDGRPDLWPALRKDLFIKRQIQKDCWAHLEAMQKGELDL